MCMHVLQRGGGGVRKGNGKACKEAILGNTGKPWNKRKAVLEVVRRRGRMRRSIADESLSTKPMPISNNGHGASH